MQNFLHNYLPAQDYLFQQASHFYKMAALKGGQRQKKSKKFGFVGLDKASSLLLHDMDVFNHTIVSYLPNF